MKPIIKYPGGKIQEINVIVNNMPSEYCNYYEPFLGGGAIFFEIDNYQSAFINDKSEELINLYTCIATQNEDLINCLSYFNTVWHKVSLFVENHKNIIADAYKLNKDIVQIYINNKKELSEIFNENYIFNKDEFNKLIVGCIIEKVDRIRELENKNGCLKTIDDVVHNIETGMKRACYTQFRTIYNQKEKYKLSKGKQAAFFFFQREYCYSSMFRYNKNGDFNVPYGGISYNKKYLDKKIIYIKSKQLRNKLKASKIGNQDFFDFMKENCPQKNDFIFLDPPYDTEFSSYAKNEFNQNDQNRLAQYLINDCKSKWMVVIKRTDYILSLYKNGRKTKNGGQIKITGFDKKYLVSFMNRNSKECEHLIITNY